MFPQLYLALRERIRATLFPDTFAIAFPTAPPDMKAVQWIDYYNGQPEDLREPETHHQYPIVLPAIFIEFGNVRFDNHANRLQRGTLNVRIHTAQEIYTDTFFQHINHAGLQPQPIESLLLRELLVATLHGFNPLPKNTLLQIAPTPIQQATALHTTCSLQHNSTYYEGKYNNMRIDIDEFSVTIERTLALPFTPQNTSPSIPFQYDIT